MAGDKRSTAAAILKYKDLAKHFVTYNDKLAALKHVGYSETYARARGYTIFAREDVQQYINEYRDELKERHLITADKIVDEMAKIAFADPTQAAKVVTKYRTFEDGSDPVPYKTIEMKDTDELTPELRAAIKSIKYNSTGSITVEFYSKTDMLVKLGETLGIFKQNINVTGKVEGSNPYEGLTTEDIKALIASKRGG